MWLALLIHSEISGGQDNEETNGQTGTIYWITIIKKQIIEMNTVGPITGTKENKKRKTN